MKDGISYVRAVPQRLCRNFSHGENITLSAASPITTKGSDADDLIHRILCCLSKTAFGPSLRNLG